MQPSEFAFQNGRSGTSTDIPVQREYVFISNLVSIILIVLGLTALFIAGYEIWYADPVKGINGKFCFPLTAGIGLIASGALFRTKWKIFASWFSLLIIGQAASLQIINAGRLIHFQHYRTLSDLNTNEYFALASICLQFIGVTIALSWRFLTIKKWLFNNIGCWRIVLALSILVFSGAAVTPDISVYANDLFFSGIVQIVSIANVILLAWSIPSGNIPKLQEKLNTFLGVEDSSKAALLRLDRFAWIAALWIVALSAFLSYFVYQAHPHVPDETQYIFQANYMAAGQLTVKPPLVPEAFSMYMVPFRESSWFSIFPPGWPAILAIGTFFGVNWIVNPLLAGLCVLLGYIFFQQLYSRRFARMAVLLLCTSPWFVFMAMSYMSHILTLVFALAAAILVYRSIDKGKAIYALFGGFAIGALGLVRPLDAAVVGLLLGLSVLIKCRGLKLKLAVGFALVFGTAALAALIFPYNAMVTGSLFLTPMDAYYNKYFWPNVMALGFGPDRGMNWGLDAFPGHSPLEAVINSALNVFLLNTELFGWATGSLLLVICFLFVGAFKKRDLWAFGLIMLICGTYGLFWYHGGPDFGARYWFLNIIPLIVLAVRGIEWLSQKVSDESSRMELNARIAIGVAMLCVGTLICYLPWRAADKYYRYLEMQPGILELAKQNNFGKSLVLIRGSEHPDYQSAWIYNSLNFEGDGPIYAFDKTPAIRAELLKNYSDRKVWIVDGPTLADGFYKIAEGPVEAGQILQESNQP